jgi:acetyl esterase/lipase
MGASLLIATTGATLLLGAAPPQEEPARGIEGYAYPHRAVHRREFGTGARSYWLFEPADPKPESAPVVVFLHGWLAVNPGAYGAWIDHLARSGRIVIFPRYQDNLSTRPADFLNNALAAIRDGLDVLATSPKHIRPDHDRFALIGHSAGGNLAAQLAAIAATSGLPVPRAVIALMPGEVQPMREPSLDQIPASTLLVVVAADDDVVVGDARAREIFQQATAIPLSRKKYVLYRSDIHGYPWLIAHHFAPTAAFRPFDTGDGFMRGFQMSQAEINAFDHYGFWRLADLTFRAAVLGRTLDDATEGGKLFGQLGYWSDGRPVLAPIVGDDLGTIPRVFPSNGLRLIKWSSPNRLRPAPPAIPQHPDESAGATPRRLDSQAEKPTTIAAP